MRMKDKTKKIVAIIVVILFVIAFAMPLLSVFVQAAPSQSQLEKALQNQQQQKSTIKDKIDDVKTEKKGVLAEKKKVDEEVKVLEDNIENISENIKNDNSNIENIQKELNVASLNAEKQYQTFKKRVRIMYEEGQSGYLEAILQSKSFTDFLNRFEIIKQIAAYDKDMLEKLKQSQKEIAEKKQVLEAVRGQKVAKVTSLNSTKTNLDAKQKQRDAMIVKLNKTESELAKTLREIEAIEAKTRAELKSLMSNSSTTKYIGGKMEWPTPGYFNITSQYGWRFHPVLKVNKLHTGVDVGAPSGAKVVAANDGKVIKAGFNSAYGNHVIIDHGGGVATLYAHASSLNVSVGQTVKRGATIMKVGSTGYSTGPHLHFEVIVNGNTVNPMGYFK